MNFTNKTYIITGAASGLGRAVSVELSKLGANLVLLDLNSSGLEETKKICRQNACVTLLTIDITDFDAIKQVFSENNWGGYQVLFIVQGFLA